ncbi:Hypothetical predicted protein [Pelobates cultripes]|uniref:Uncharacterized protein n=1 Tax=Pelobates cultripes TaxID=61616 RepID=A0AAD1VR95_PELCU|nr:Hypothetical predicted protein [Pelobates cultripes]
MPQCQRESTLTRLDAIFMEFWHRHEDRQMSISKQRYSPPAVVSSMSGPKRLNRPAPKRWHKQVNFWNINHALSWGLIWRHSDPTAQAPIRHLGNQKDLGPVTLASGDRRPSGRQ